MNRLVRGSIMVAAVAAAWACSTDLGENPDQTDRLSADPTVMFIANDDSQAVEVEALNSAGQQLAADFSVSDPGTGIVITPDTSFLPIPGQGQSPTRARFTVRAATPGTFVSTTFTVSANGQSIDIPVNITPATIAATFSNPTPAVGEFITITAPGALRFTPASVVTSSGGVVFLSSLSADSTTLTVAFGPDAVGSTITVTNAVVPYLPGQTFTVTSSGTVTTPLSSDFPIGINNFNPAIGDQLVLTAPAPFKFTPASVPRIPNAGFFVQSVSADSSTITILIGPNADSVLAVTNLVIPSATGLGTFTLGTAGVVTSPVVDDFAANYSDATPDINQNVTLSAGTLKFLPTATVRIGTDNQTITARAADSSSITFRAHKQFGALDTLKVNGIAFANLLQVPLLLPADVTPTVSATVLTLAGTDQLATAPLVDIPPTGLTGGVIDNGPFPAGPTICTNTLGGPCKVYKFVTTATRSFGVSASWSNPSDADEGVYFTNSTGTALVGTTGCDIHFEAPGNFESCTVSNLAAGTYFIVFDDFSPFYGPPFDVPPARFQIDLTGL